MEMPVTRLPFIATLTAATALLAGCGGAPEPAEETAAQPEAAASAPVALPETITAERGGFIPEGVEFDTAGGRLLTGSLAEGSIFQLHEDGRVTAVVTDAELVSSVGIEADEPRNRLLVANSDRSVFQGGGRGHAKLGVYDLASGARLAMVDLGATLTNAPADTVHFANDVAVADDGTAYVTDTRAGVVYRVTPDFQASVLSRFDAIDGFAPNGIVYHPSGYLLVASGGSLWKVQLDDAATATQVTLPEEIPGQDGMVWRPDGALAIVSNSGNRVVALTSADDWATASVAGVATYDTQATTAAVVGDDIYVVHPHFADADPPSVQRVTFQ